MISGWISAIVLLAGLFQQTLAPPPAQPQFRIAGTLVNALDGQPISRAEVRISLAREQDEGKAVLTEDDGRFDFEHVAPGKYILTARLRGFAQQDYLQHGPFQTAIVVGPGMDSAAIVFPLLPDASISGQVTNELNDPVRSSQVLLFSQSTDDGKQEIRQHGQATTDDEGRYYFSHLGPGTYYLAIAAQPWYSQYIQPNETGRVKPGSSSGSSANQEASLDVAYPVTFYPTATDCSGAEPILLKSGDKADADFNLRPVPAVHVRVKDPGAGSSPNFNGFQVQALKTIFGNYHVDVPLTISSTTPETIELGGLASGTFEVQYTSRTGEEISAKTEELTVTADAEITLDQDAAGSRVRGVVRIEGSSVIPNGPTVALQNVDTRQVQNARADASGKFEFEHFLFAAGRYQVLANSGPDFVLRTLAATGARVSGENIEVNGTDDVRLALVLSRAVPVVDGIALRDAKSVAGAMIVLVPQDPENNQSLFRRDQTDSDGSFSLYNVVPGNYTVVALEDAWNLEWANPAVIGKYLPGGIVVHVETEGKYNLRVSAQ
jgi:hypothetical protein